MEVTPDILLVIATIVAVFSFSSIIGAWTVKRWPWLSMISFSIAIGLFAYLHFEMTDGLTPLDVPNAFISVAARVVN
ncbi:hypothetical protein [Gymnodinialimonas hymeniacidonis]|uniref:hypothetical protein n=1 Tax=Gymnodinialimonas hymeniacidonis TaxID=3126508 RepID=UPI0034C63E40